MKNAVFTFLFFALFAFTATAQAPQAFKYQTVVRDAAGNVQANTTVNIWTDLVQNGLDVYQENHNNLTTNAFGLVNLNVGRGAVVSGAFDAIDWSIPTYIKVWLNGQEMGTSELLSVPYALYAAKGGNSELPASPQTGDIVYYDGTAWQGLPAGAPGTVLTMGADGLPAWKAASQLDSLLKVTMTNGDVIYASPVDNNAPGSVGWGGTGTDITALTNSTTLAAANMDFAGAANTAAIVAQLGDNGGTAYAAKVCADLVAYGFDDWYLPAAGELNEMYKKLGPVANGGSGQITSGYYWSSSEYINFFAWYQIFDDGSQYNDLKDFGYQCRCVRR